MVIVAASLSNPQIFEPVCSCAVRIVGDGCAVVLQCSGRQNEILAQTCVQFLMYILTFRFVVAFNGLVS